MRSSPPLLRIAWRNVLRNARHSLGSILAISVGFIALVLFDGFFTWVSVDNARDVADRFMLNDLVVDRRGALDARASGAPFEETVLSEREQEFLEGYLAARASEVIARGRFLYLHGSASTGKASTEFVAYGLDVAAGTQLRGRYAWDALAGRPLRPGSENEVVLSRGLGALLGCEPSSDAPWYGEDGSPIAEERPFACRRPRVQLVASTASGQLNAVEPEVVGLIDGGLVEVDSKYLNIPLALGQRLLDTRGVSIYVVRLHDPAGAAAFSRDLVAAAGAAGIALEAMPWKEHYSGEEHRRGLQILGAYRALVSAVVVLIAAMSVLTTMAKAVAERTREVGTLRSLGFLRRQIVRLFALEAALLAGVGIAAGAGASIAITVLVNRARIPFDGGVMSLPLPLTISFVPSSYAIAAAFLAALSALAAVGAARRAVRSRIPDALAHV